MKGCAHCGGKFGLIRRRWHSRQFCSLRWAFFNRVSAIMPHANCSNFGPHQRFSFDMILRRRGDPLGGYPLLGPGASRGLFFRAQWGIFFNTRDRSGSPSWAAS
jgi:hypothetical protein